MPVQIIIPAAVNAAAGTGATAAAGTAAANAAASAAAGTGATAAAGTGAANAANAANAAAAASSIDSLKSSFEGFNDTLQGISDIQSQINSPKTLVGKVLDAGFGFTPGGIAAGAAERLEAYGQANSKQARTAIVNNQGEQFLAEKAKEAGEKLKYVTFGVSKFGGVAVSAAQEVMKWSDELSRANIRLSTWNANISAAAQTLEANRIGREIEFAEGTSGTAADVIGAQNQLEEALLPIRSMMRNIGNDVTAHLARILTSGIQTADALSAIAPGVRDVRRMLEERYGRNVPSSMPILQMHHFMAENHRQDMQARRMTLSDE